MVTGTFASIVLFSKSNSFKEMKNIQTSEQNIKSLFQNQLLKLNTPVFPNLTEKKGQFKMRSIGLV